ncbi:TRM-domain-containing protein [Xylona heveae TC161]|uniref:tRNA (guanine(26)-N(2))-dimethyltransferase n=1 Tax=Xylona heveae (strain CBS 132557 / TC161) TaxID=1328760 RepID=A0A165FNR2_XYLHT|nr:TRM-domain-containing protein [Xylona heveae TC161]KZF21198.1 TRM-domain-containing protein [Xylona heveae TC161]
MGGGTQEAAQEPNCNGKNNTPPATTESEKQVVNQIQDAASTQPECDVESAATTGTEVQTASISDPPRAGQRVIHNGKEFTTVKEGLAYVLIPARSLKSAQQTVGGGDQAQSVFYNPIQQFNRDLSVLAIRAFGEDLTAVRKEKRENRKSGKKRKRGAAGAGTANESGEQEQGHSVRRKTEHPENGDAETAATDVRAKADDNAQEKVVGNEPAPVDQTASAEVSAQAPKADAHDCASTSNSWRPQFTILDALSATGLRALRYAQEIPFATSITANDLLPDATESIKLNVEHNKLEDKINAVTGNAIAHMYSFVGQPTQKLPESEHSASKYDVIDLDPYGTAVPFLDAAVQSVTDGGLLCVTCTDAGVFASTGYPEKTYSLYGGLPLKGPHAHEAGVRLILNSVATSAARYGLSIEPLLSLSIDFYARVFVRIRHSPAEVKFLAGKTMLVYNCDAGCGAWTTQLLGRHRLTEGKKGVPYYKHGLEQGPSAAQRCEHCGSKTHMAGPMYAGPLHSPEFIRRILSYLPKLDSETYATTNRIKGMLVTALEEDLNHAANRDEDISSPRIARMDPAEIDHHPFFFVPSAVAKVLHCQTPQEDSLRGALRGLGYRVTRSHTRPGSIKSDAPWSVIWEMMREWVRQKSPVKEGAIRQGTAGWGIMNGPQPRMGSHAASTANASETASDASAANEYNASPSTASRTLNVVFNETLGREKDGRRLVRYQVNPRANWGPMKGAKGGN